MIEKFKISNSNINSIRYIKRTTNFEKINNVKCLYNYDYTFSMFLKFHNIKCYNNEDFNYSIYLGDLELMHLRIDRTDLPKKNLFYITRFVERVRFESCYKLFLFYLFDDLNDILILN